MDDTHTAGLPVERLPRPEELLAVLKESADEVFNTMLATVAVLVESRTDRGDHLPAETVDIEAIVDFSGLRNGAVVLSCTPEGAMDLTRDLLMLGADETVGLEEIKDALGECANMVCGLLKSKALDAVGHFQLGTPRIEAYENSSSSERCGTLVYRLSNGCVSIEIWMQIARVPH